MKLANIFPTLYHTPNQKCTTRGKYMSTYTTKHDKNNNEPQVYIDTNEELDHVPYLDTAEPYYCKNTFDGIPHVYTIDEDHAILQTTTKFVIAVIN